MDLAKFLCVMYHDFDLAVWNGAKLFIRDPYDIGVMFTDFVGISQPVTIQKSKDRFVGTGDWYF